MATIVRTASGKWKAVIRMKGWPTATMTMRTKRDVEDWARKTEDDMVRGVYIQRAPAERTTVREALDRYLKEITPTKAEKTQQGERRRIPFLAKHLGSYSLAALTPELVSKYRDQRLSGAINPRGTRDGGRSASTVRNELAILSNLYSVAIREWRMGLVYNPCTIIRKPKASPGRFRRLKTDEEQRLFKELDAHSNPMLGQVARIALETGMRSSEITSLRRSQVNFPKRVVILHQTKNNEPREVPLSDLANAVLREAMNHPVRPIDSDLVFFGEPGRKDKRRKPYVFEKMWAQAKERAGIKNFRFHDLRHEAGSRFAEGGLDARKIAEILGHKDLKMAMIYVNLYGRDLVDEVNVALQKRKARGLGA